MFQIKTYDRHGAVLGELNRAYNVVRSYAVNKSGSLTFEISLWDGKIQESLLTRDNIIIVWSDELEPWSGYIADVTWTSDGFRVTCVSIEQRFGRRRTQPHLLTNEYAGSIILYLIAQANSEDHTSISVGSTFEGGLRYTLSLVADNIYDKIIEHLDQARYEYRVDLVVPGVWTFNLYERRGADLTDKVVLFTSRDIDGSADYREDNTKFANRITAVGKAPESTARQSNPPEGSTIADWERRPKATYTDDVSVGTYGLSEDTIDFSDVQDADTLLQLARREVETRKQPVRTVTLVVNKRRALWSQFSDGDILSVQLPLYDFGGVAVPIRVLGREIDEDKELMTLAGEVVEGERARTLAMYSAFHYDSYASGQSLYTSSVVFSDPLVEAKIGFV